MKSHQHPQQRETLSHQHSADSGTRISAGIPTQTLAREFSQLPPTGKGELPVCEASGLMLRTQPQAMSHQFCLGSPESGLAITDKHSRAESTLSPGSWLQLSSSGSFQSLPPTGRIREQWDNNSAPLRDSGTPGPLRDWEMAAQHAAGAPRD